MVIDLVDGTYELFRHFYGLRRFTKDKDRPYGGVTGVLNGVLEMVERGATHVGVATDHVIESFRNKLWAGYKTGEGIEPALLAQFHPLEEALAALGVVVWPMVELEAEDALAYAARLGRGLSYEGRAMPPARVSWQNETRLRFAVKGIAPEWVPWMCEQVGLKLTALRRIRIGRIAMAGLPLGQWRYLPPGERF